MIDWRHSLSTTDPSYYKWTQWVFLQLLQAGPGVQEGRGGQLVPERQDRARQRAGRRRRVRALRREGRAAVSRAVVLPDHRVRRAAARQSRHASTGRKRRRRRSATGSASPRAPRSSFRSTRGSRGERRTRCGTTSAVFTTRPDTIFGATYLVLAPEHPLVDALTHRRAARGRDGVRARAAKQDLVTRKVEQGEDGRLHRRVRDESGDAASRFRSGSPTTC